MKALCVWVGFLVGSYFNKIAAITNQAYFFFFSLTNGFIISKKPHLLFAVSN